MTVYQTSMNKQQYLHSYFSELFQPDKDQLEMDIISLSEKTLQFANNFVATQLYTLERCRGNCQ